ncbi:MAG TPA: tRNA (guanosine(37)-N1)-methyltransferase TrmD [Hyphomicrobium sp.]|nr:tRNA (guanosine(37)-N1)-methyltransferase TrmD [Hyphomicrobium sp.]
MAHFPTHDGRTPWRASVLTLFPEMFPGPLGLSLIGQALAAGLWTLATHPIRDFGLGRHAQVDDTPAGGGAGMVLRADVLGPAIDQARTLNPDAPAIYLSPRGSPLDQALVRKLSEGPGVLLVAGRFEGIDERVIEARGLREVSIGDYVLSGGDLAAMVLIDACVRLIPGVLGKNESIANESFEDGLLEHPHYTKPRVWEGLPIPDVLLSGDHKKIEAWRREQALKATAERRPDLIARRPAR